MSEIRLYKKPKKAIFLLLTSLVFVAIGIWLVTDLNSDRTEIIKGFLGIAFFGLGVIVGLFHLLDKRPQIIITEKGIWDRTTKSEEIPWQVIDDAYPINVSGQKFISLVLNKDFESRIRGYRWVSNFNRKIGAQKVNIQLSQLAVNPVRLTDLILKMRILDEEGRKKEIKNVAQHR